MKTAKLRPMKNPSAFRSACAANRAPRIALGFYRHRRRNRRPDRGVDALPVAADCQRDGRRLQRQAACAFGKDCYLVAWCDGTLQADRPTADIYAARIDHALGKSLDPAGIRVCAAADFQERPAVAFDGTNFLVVWQDFRNGRDYDIYAARVSPQGRVLDPDGFPVIARAGNQARPAVLSPAATTSSPGWTPGSIPSMACMPLACRPRARSSSRGPGDRHRGPAHVRKGHATGQDLAGRPPLLVARTVLTIPAVPRQRREDLPCHLAAQTFTPTSRRARALVGPATLGLLAKPVTLSGEPAIAWPPVPSPAVGLWPSITGLAVGDTRADGGRPA